jgi:hypothetical protein
MSSMSANRKRPVSPPSLKELRDLKRGKRLSEKWGKKAASDEGWEFIDKKRD